MSRVCSCSVALFVLAMAALMGSCSSSSPPISVSLSPSSPQAIDQSQTLGITATVTNDTSSKGASWRAEAAGIALQEQAAIAATRETNARERGWLADRLQSLGLKVFSSAANYVL